MDEPKKPRRKKANPAILHCSFCKKSQHEVRKLIAGPGVLICDECIDLCNDIIGETDLEQALGDNSVLIKYIEQQHMRAAAIFRRISRATAKFDTVKMPGGETRH